MTDIQDLPIEGGNIYIWNTTTNYMECGISIWSNYHSRLLNGSSYIPHIINKNCIKGLIL